MSDDPDRVALTSAVAWALEDARRVACSHDVTAIADVPSSNLVAPDALAALRGTGLDAVVLGPEVAAVGPDGRDHSDERIAAAAHALRPGGTLVIIVPARLAASRAGRTDGRSAADVARLIGHRGLAQTLLAAPGVGSALDGAPQRTWRPDVDRTPGLLDAGRWIVGAGTWPGAPEERSRHFFATLPRKVVAAGVICTADDGRMLVVHDTFRMRWTIPGGVVDADEPLADAAGREAREETGLSVEVGDLLGVFSATWPDRLLALFAARPAGGIARDPHPEHPHEVDAAVWLPLDDALERLNPRTAWEVRTCLNAPGRTWSI